MSTLSCKEASRLMSQGQDRDLTVGEKLALRAHLAICAACRNFDEQLAFLRRAVRRLAEKDPKGD
jgi:predicted anti-sigma-YlaC factor YlaD